MGKSTQIAALAAWLRARDFDVVLTREPGGSPLGEKVRELLLQSKDITARAELFLFEACRAQLVETIIRPAVESGKVVLCDRYIDSAYVYQGIVRKLGAKNVDFLNRFATDSFFPQLTFVLDVPEDQALARMEARQAKGDARNRMDLESTKFHSQVRKAFRQLAKKEPKRVTLVNGARYPEQVTHELIEKTARRFKIQP